MYCGQEGLNCPELLRVRLGWQKGREGPLPTSSCWLKGLQNLHSPVTCDSGVRDWASLNSPQRHPCRGLNAIMAQRCCNITLPFTPCHQHFGLHEMLYKKERSAKHVQHIMLTELVT